MAARAAHTSSESKAVRITRVVRENLLGREYRPGQCFLSNNEFAERFGVSPLTANRIIASLAGEGLLRRERGRGTFVTKKVLGLAESDAPDGIGTVAVVFFEDPVILQTGIGEPGVRSWHHPLGVIQALELAVAVAGGRVVLVNQHPDLDLTPRAVSAAIASGAGAILVVARTDDPLTPEAVEAIRAAGVPTVVVGNDCGDAVDSTAYDNRGIGFAAAEHLMRLGHERIAFVTFVEPFRWADERLRGFTEALVRRGRLAADVVCVRLAQQQHLLRPVHLADALRGALAGVSGVVCVNESIAGALRLAALEAGIEVPGRLSFTGVDDLAQNRAYDLTTFQQPGHELGRAGANILLRRLAGDRTPGVLRELVACPLIPRSSTGPYTGVTAAARRTATSSRAGAAARRRGRR